MDENLGLHDFDRTERERGAGLDFQTVDVQVVVREPAVHGMRKECDLVCAGQWCVRLVGP